VFLHYLTADFKTPKFNIISTCCILRYGTNKSTKFRSNVSIDMVLLMEESNFLRFSSKNFGTSHQQHWNSPACVHEMLFTLKLTFLLIVLLFPTVICVLFHYTDFPYYGVVAFFSMSNCIYFKVTVITAILWPCYSSCCCAFCLSREYFNNFSFP
jgi:hypothetical protein